MKVFPTIQLVVFCLHIDLATSETDLYDVLSVERNANQKQIKQAYKNLAKTWHPDKNRETGANEKFMKINEAYETLSDPEKRTEYDKFGRTSSQQQQQSNHHSDGFEQFFGHQGFGGGGFRFNFHDGMDDKYRITLRSWTKNVLPESDTKPYVVYAYSDFCFKCMQLEPIWDKFTADLELIGMGIGTINTRMDNDLAYKLGIGSLPRIFVIISGKLTYYSKTHYSLSELRFFLRDLQMSRDIQQVGSGNYKDFLASWTDNRVRVVYYGNKPSPPLRIVLAAYAFRRHIVFGHVNTLKPENAGLLSDYGVNAMAETLMVFHEDVSSPVATMSMQQLGRQSIDEVLEANKYLTLPRLSSSAIFKDLCPTEKAIRNRKLCVVLLTKSTAAHDDHRQTFRDYARQHPENRLRFLYMYEDKQTVFIHSLTKGGEHSDSGTKLKVAILWRPDAWRVTYSWLDGGWDVDSLNQCETELTAALDKILTHNTELTMVAKWTELVDEHQLHLLTRIGVKLLDWADNIYHYLASYDTLTLTTVATAVVILVFMGYFMQYIIAESDEARAKPNNIRRQTPRASPAETVESVKFQELRFETFDQLVVESEPGKITVVLLTLEQTRDKLLQTYADTIKPYSRSKYFTFAFLQLETYLFWYEHLLEETIGYRRTISINPHNVVGTVLVLNGFRKYYCMYHAVHKQHKQKQKQTGGEFMGFNASDGSSDSDDQPGDESTTPDILFEKDLLNGLQNFMDRFVEGSLKRYKVEHWPEMVTY